MPPTDKKKIKPSTKHVLYFCIFLQLEDIFSDIFPMSKQSGMGENPSKLYNWLRIIWFLGAWFRVSCKTLEVHVGQGIVQKPHTSSFLFCIVLTSFLHLFSGFFYFRTYFTLLFFVAPFVFGVYQYYVFLQGANDTPIRGSDTIFSRRYNFCFPLKTG